MVSFPQRPVSRDPRVEAIAQARLDCQLQMAAVVKELVNLSIGVPGWTGYIRVQLDVAGGKKLTILRRIEQRD